ncbi:uncharacterized protein LOC143445290 [Clavelina lepadiformis]|uniref:uncharacterized protein LOC143445290 n=1 Tax=Clavelina lepadiformis TaxID=159417 RepID=UPI0040414DB4
MANWLFLKEKQKGSRNCTVFEQNPQANLCTSRLQPAANLKTRSMNKKRERFHFYRTISMSQFQRQQLLHNHKTKKRIEDSTVVSNASVVADKESQGSKYDERQRLEKKNAFRSKIGILYFHNNPL